MTGIPILGPLISMVDEFILGPLISTPSYPGPYIPTSIFGP